jgi:hypothetical protein
LAAVRAAVDKQMTRPVREIDRLGQPAGTLLRGQSGQLRTVQPELEFVRK